MFEDLFAKFNFWRARKFVKLDRDYEFFLDLSNHEAMAVRILKKYPGVIVEYTNVHMSSDNQMSFDMTIVANPNICNVESKKFKDFTMSIFRSILNDSLSFAKKEGLNENRNADSFVLDSERTFHEEVVTVSEERVPDRKPRKKTVRRNKAVHSKVQQSAPDSSPGN